MICLLLDWICLIRKTWKAWCCDSFSETLFCTSYVFLCNCFIVLLKCHHFILKNTYLLITGSCLVRFSKFMAKFQLCKCPMCESWIYNLVPYTPVMIQPGREEVGEILGEIEQYNRENEVRWFSFFVACSFSATLIISSFNQWYIILFPIHLHWFS